MSTKACPTCTFANPPGWKVCAMCSRSNPSMWQPMAADRTNTQQQETIDEELARRLQRELNTRSSRDNKHAKDNNAAAMRPRDIVKPQVRSNNQRQPYLKKGTGGGGKRSNNSRSKVKSVNSGRRSRSRSPAGGQKSSGYGQKHRNRRERNRPPPSGSSDKFEEAVESEIVDSSPNVKWSDVAGLDTAKQTLQEAVILPMLRPDIFKGVREPPRGVLLYGPPGTGKTMLAKAVATESRATFLAISSSALTSKWVGESSKLVKAMFEVARKRAPAVIFIDEIDSVLSARTDGEHNASRQLKTEFLVQFDGVRNKESSEETPHVLIIGATNRPWELDEAVRRRMAKRIFIPMPSPIARGTLLQNMMQQGEASYAISSVEVDHLVIVTEGYSGSDLAALVREAALGPIRELGCAVANIDEDEIRPYNVADFQAALCQIRASVRDQTRYEEWTRSFGTNGSGQ